MEGEAPKKRFSKTGEALVVILFVCSWCCWWSLPDGIWQALKMRSDVCGSAGRSRMRLRAASRSCACCRRDPSSASWHKKGFVLRSRDISTPGSMFSAAAAVSWTAPWYVFGACCGEPPVLLSLLLSGDPGAAAFDCDSLAVSSCNWITLASHLNH